MSSLLGSANFLFELQDSFNQARSGQDWTWREMVGWGLVASTGICGTFAALVKCGTFEALTAASALFATRRPRCSRYQGR
jgi:hypothetical protein